MTLEYRSTCVQEVAYVEPQKQGEIPRTFRRRVYWTLRAMAEASNRPRVMLIIQLHPSANWKRLWINLHACWTTEDVKVTWYVVIQDILPTKERLHKIRLTDSPLCRQCGEPDTFQLRIT